MQSLPDSLVQILDPAMQKYVDKPPGEGKSIVYAIVNMNDFKMYVGKHSHGRHGRSMRSTRLSSFLNPPADDTSYKANAVRKHGKEVFKPFIIWHGDTCNENSQEVFWISPYGLHTIKDNGGWGYNNKGGGDGGAPSVSLVAKMTALRNTEEYKTEKSIIAKEQMKREAASGMKSLPDRWRNYIERETDEQRAARLVKLKAAQNKPEHLAKHSARAKEQMTQPEAIDRQSKQARTWWETATTEQTEKMESARAVTITASRKRRMDGMTAKEQRMELARQAKNARRASKAKNMLLAVRAMPGYEKATAKTVVQLRKEGKLPKID